MKKLTSLVLFIFVSITIIAGTYTQFLHYSIKDGLSEINVLCVLQDKKGQMWFGTFDGLNKFNGYNFGQLSGIENYRIDKIHEDKNGYLLI